MTAGGTADPSATVEVEHIMVERSFTGRAANHHGITS
jgi:hypothetical protein